MPARSNKKGWWGKAFDEQKDLSCATCNRSLREGVCSKRQWHMATERPPRGRCNDCIRRDPHWKGETSASGRGWEEERLAASETKLVAEPGTGGFEDLRTAAAWLDKGAMEKSSGSERSSSVASKEPGEQGA